MQLKEVCYEILYLAQRERIVVTGNSVEYSLVLTHSYTCIGLNIYSMTVAI